jgi:hypothetical protein
VQEKWQPKRVERVMKEVLEERLSSVTYDPLSCQLLAKEIATEIQKRVKDFRWQRYRIVCHVSNLFSSIQFNIELILKTSLS